MKWNYHKNQNAFVKENGLNSKTLHYINNTYKEIQKTIVDRLQELELFRVIGDTNFIFGGGDIKIKSDKHKKRA